MWAIGRCAAPDVVRYIATMATPLPFHFPAEYYTKLFSGDRRKWKHMLLDPIVFELHLKWGARINDLVSPELRKTLLEDTPGVEPGGEHALLYSHLAHRLN